MQEREREEVEHRRINLEDDILESADKYQSDQNQLNFQSESHLSFLDSEIINNKISTLAPSNMPEVVEEDMDLPMTDGNETFKESII